jgi:ABC-type transport system involved in multi-copper enzyme maturation permease subunit
MGTTAWLQLREIFSGKKIWLAVLLAAFPVALTLVVVRAGGWDEGRPDILLYVKLTFLFVLHPMLTCPLLSLLYGTAIVNADVERKTITYLFTRPVAKWKIVAGKYAAVVGFLAGPVTLSLLICWALLGAPGGARFIGIMLTAVLGAVAAYTAVFAAIGTLFRNRPLVVGLLYAFVVEGVLSFIPGAMVNAVTVTYYLRSLAFRAAHVELPPELAFLTRFAAASLPESVAVLLGIAACALTIASVVVTRREYSVADAV